MNSASFSLKAYHATSEWPRTPIEIAIAEWRELPDCVVESASPDLVYQIAACSSYTSNELDAFGIPFRHRFEDPYSAKEPSYEFILVNAATVIGDTGVIVNNQGDLLLESLFPSIRHNPFQQIPYLPGFEDCTGSCEYDDDVFVMFGGGGFSNYWHFHLDVLPTITFLRQAGLLQKIKLAVPVLRDWQREVFRRMKINESQILELSNSVNRFRRCCLLSTIYQPTLTIPNQIARATIAELREAARHEKDISASNFAEPRFVYVSRVDSLTRQLTNEAELIGKLKDLGFDVIVGSSLSYSEQTNAVSNACVIVGLHGAGLTNIIFAEMHALVVEILPFGVLRAPHYYLLASTLGLQYEMFVSRLRSFVSPHDHWTLEVDEFIFKLICALKKRNVADGDVMLNKIKPIIHDAFISPLDVLLSSPTADQSLQIYGFSGMEHWGCWMAGAIGALQFTAALPTRFRLLLEVEVFAPALTEVVSITCGSSYHHVMSPTNIIDCIFSNEERRNIIWIYAPGAISPAKVNNQPFDDSRLLSIAVKRIVISEAFYS